MSKVLVAVRLDHEVVDLLKDMAKSEGKTQADVVTIALGMFHNTLLYAKKSREVKVIQEDNKKVIKVEK